MCGKVDEKGRIGVRKLHAVGQRHAVISALPMERKRSARLTHKMGALAAHPKQNTSGRTRRVKRIRVS
ncbi:MAG: hypothetical protein D6698_12910 [Gammaproteobacteria bacterium]|nr:MAG: hypothetical protein D6698_12910 [Gammaproteobacteria bacterium]